MWIVCQIGAREHYAIPRALDRSGRLAGLVTDFWVPPGSIFAKLPGARRLRDRFHGDLAGGRVVAPNLRMLGFEMSTRLRKAAAWPGITARNALFQKQALTALDRISRRELEASIREPITLFSYSYAARDLFRFAKARGWKTVLGQIDPGPVEERIVAEEHRRYAHLKSRWNPAPKAYWQSWREEVALADRIIVNSQWSRHCLLQEDVPAEKIEVVPLVYDQGGGVWSSAPREKGKEGSGEVFRVLFLGQINLRKGIGRLLDAMRLLKEEPIELTLAGPTEIDPSAWADLPKVKWIGRVARSQVGTVYRAADLFVLPTLSDGYALTQLEALAHGLPILASANCGEVVVHDSNGWLLEDLEPMAIAASIRKSMQSYRMVTSSATKSLSISDLGSALNT